MAPVGIEEKVKLIRRRNKENRHLCVHIVHQNKFFLMTGIFVYSNDRFVDN